MFWGIIFTALAVLDVCTYCHNHSPYALFIAGFLSAAALDAFSNAIRKKSKR